VERLRAGARADIKWLHRRLDIAKKDVVDAESRLGMTMDTLHKLTKEEDEWKRTRLQMMTDMESCRTTTVGYGQQKDSATQKFKRCVQLRKKRSMRWRLFKQN
jgi:hypothetical protein